MMGEFFLSCLISFMLYVTVWLFSNTIVHGFQSGVNKANREDKSK